MKNEHTIHALGIANVTRLQQLQREDAENGQDTSKLTNDESLKGGHAFLGLPIGDTFEFPERDWKGISYKQLFRSLNEEKTPHIVGTMPHTGVFDEFYEKGYLYDPEVLDGPDHRRSLVDGFVKGNQFFAKSPTSRRKPSISLPPSLTIHDIRNIKKPTLIACIHLSIEISTVALAVISFERLCIKSVVNKSNLKLTMAVALILAYKFNEPVNANFKSKLEGLLDFIDRSWQISKKQVLAAEFGGYVWLGFTLHVPQAHMHFMYIKLLKMISKSSKEYLGDEMYETYKHERIMCESARTQDLKIRQLKADELRLSTSTGLLSELQKQDNHQIALNMINNELSSDSESSSGSSSDSDSSSSDDDYDTQDDGDEDLDRDMHSVAGSPSSTTNRNSGGKIDLFGKGPAGRQKDMTIGTSGFHGQSTPKMSGKGSSPTSQSFIQRSSTS